MSFTKNDRKFQRGGRMTSIAHPITNHTVAERFSEAICRYTDKQLARMTGGCPRAFRNHRQALNAPSAATLINLMRESDEVFHAVLDMAQRAPVPASDMHERVTQVLEILGGQNEVSSYRVSPDGGSKEREK